jgi:large subunit ribosomal protein L20
MTRARSGKTVLRKRARMRKLTKGFRLSRHNLWRQSKVTLMRGGVYAFRDRRVRKREFRKLWIVRINAACRQAGISYSKFMHGLKAAGVDLDRKVLAEVAAGDPANFTLLIEKAKAALEPAAQ